MMAPPSVFKIDKNDITTQVLDTMQSFRRKYNTPVAQPLFPTATVFHLNYTCLAKQFI